MYSILIFYKQNICRRKQKYPHPVAMNSESKQKKDRIDRYISRFERLSLVSTLVPDLTYRKTWSYQSVYWLFCERLFAFQFCSNDQCMRRIEFFLHEITFDHIWTVQISNLPSTAGI